MVFFHSLVRLLAFKTIEYNPLIIKGIIIATNNSIKILLIFIIVEIIDIIINNI